MCGTENKLKIVIFTFFRDYLNAYDLDLKIYIPYLNAYNRLN